MKILYLLHLRIIRSLWKIDATFSRAVSLLIAIMWSMWSLISQLVWRRQRPAERVKAASVTAPHWQLMPVPAAERGSQSNGGALTPAHLLVNIITEMLERDRTALK